MHTLYYLLLIISTAFFSGMFLWGASALLPKLAMLDHPETRSNHEAPVPTGAGIAFMLAAVSFLFVVDSHSSVLWATAALMVVSWMDDRKSLSVKMRLGVQIIAVIIAMDAIPAGVFQGLLPDWFEKIIVGGLWLWMINLYNFMDGIDEMTLTQTTALCVGLIILGASVDEIPRALAIDAMIIVSAVVCFWPWNKHPARMFMGDSGSVPLGFLMGYLLFSLAATGHWAAALILPAYYLLDATLTLAKRAIARKPIWQAHSEHYYQQAVRAGRSHSYVTRRVAVLNALLIIVACISVFVPMLMLPALGVAYALAAACLILFSRSPSHAGAPAHP